MKTANYEKQMNGTEFLGNLELPQTSIDSDLVEYTDKHPILLLNSNNCIEFVSFNDLVFLEADGPKTNVYTNNKKYSIGKNLAKFNFLENFQGFFRASRFYIVNSTKIVRIVKNTASRELLLSNGSSLEFKNASKNHDLNQFLKSSFYFI